MKRGECRSNVESLHAQIVLHHGMMHGCRESRERTIERERLISRSARNVFFSTQVPLPLRILGGGDIQPGQYQFPFSFVLPLGMPGTFNLEDGYETINGRQFTHTRADVKFRVRAMCVVPGVFKPNVRHKHSLAVQQRLPKPPSETISSCHGEVKKCCCINEGACSVTVSVQKDS